MKNSHAALFDPDNADVFKHGLKGLMYLAASLLHHHVYSIKGFYLLV